MEHSIIRTRPNVAVATLTLLALLPGTLHAQDIAGLKLDRIASIPREVLDSITARGKLLAEYDFASWYATDAVSWYASRAYEESSFRGPTTS
jgi:hypothetical protein